MDRKKIEEGVRLILEGIGEDADRPGLKDTPARVAKMYAELFAGLKAPVEDLLKPIEGESHDEVLASLGMTSVSPGSRSTSSNVRPSGRGCSSIGPP